MSESNEENVKKNFFKEFFLNNKKIIIYSFITLIAVIIIYIGYGFYGEKKNTRVGNLYNQANVLLSNKKNEEAMMLYEEVILEKNKFYSPLSLNIIIENDLKSDGEILKLFDQVIKIRSLSKEDKNLIILKKEIFLKKKGDEDQILDTLNPIINEKSIWADLAVKTLRDFYFFKGEKNKSAQYEEILLKKTN